MSNYRYMLTSELLAVLLSLSHGVRCNDVVVRFECENLETVYVFVDGGRLVASDRGETFAYLQGAVPVTRARAVCAEFGVEVDNTDPRRYPRIRRVLAGDEHVQPAVDLLVDAMAAVNARREG